ncbi:hypothetical protein ACFWF7_35425 [Nocardia sp. NPDC060256]|uniref:hypothetical protein n=1 Tax=unclassified Nocardia TaxID=2637762 RepID=UPI00364B4958
MMGVTATKKLSVTIGHSKADHGVIIASSLLAADQPKALVKPLQMEAVRRSATSYQRILLSNMMRITQSG